MDLVDAAGTCIALGERIGGGGEGDVHALPGQPNRCVKILHPERRLHKHAKVRAMIAAPPQGALEDVDGSPVLTWPRVAVYASQPNRDDTFVGYVMTRIRPTDFVPFHQVTATARRAALGGQPLTFDRMVLLGLRLAHVVRTLHRFGYAVGDLNDRNVLVSRRLTPLLMDTDSFEVPNGRGHYPSTVGDALYWPPDLLDTDLRNYTGSRVPGDRYALGVLLFQLFMGGLRPYQARGSRVAHLPTVEAKARAGLYPWAKPKPGELEPPANSPPYHALPKPLRDAFERCFVAGHHKPRARPTADDWCNVLAQLRDTGFVTCSREARHVYLRSQAHCPWCPARQDPFIATVTPRPRSPRAPKSGGPVKQPPPVKRKARGPPQRPLTTQAVAKTATNRPSPAKATAPATARKTNPSRANMTTTTPLRRGRPPGARTAAGERRRTRRPPARMRMVGRQSARWLTVLTSLLLATWWLVT